ncbi:LytTR family transcriptional regulator DNA-binding domain-containing protein [Siminovitchia fortis]|uniref:LytR family transcriptional regulator n=1 Tax=Siminovitchia fortis TaxID=254758 RepID=A0A443IN91_9BACI|nr:LytTR family transcriptional regulator DNA-binding domain-containing protein [Siminovitchia fortis]RWR07309.1 LytR family transcriptional regulator [Siminovitchia fortis]WHY81532.1 LytTR family transcriptional regulator DNA-binding domain-containing protein [Siminovitchia fortis]
MNLQFVDAEKRVHDTIIFPSFDLSVNPGQVSALYSSVNAREQIINLLLGKTALSHGEIRVGHKRLQHPSKDIGFLFLNTALYERLSIDEMLKFIKNLYESEQNIDRAIKAVRLDEKRKTRINKLSYSESRRVQFACLLLQNPAIYILEEPDQNLDLESKQIFLSLLQELRHSGKAILILTGNMESAVTAADEVYKLDVNGLSPIQVENNDPEKNEDQLEKEQQTDTAQPVQFKKIPTKVKDKIVLFNPPEIDYIESREGQSFIHIKGEAFPSDFTLQELENRLLPFGFFRCHRSYIVNLQKVREVITWTRNSYSLVLEDTNKSTIPLSKSKMSVLKEMLGLK